MRTIHILGILILLALALPASPAHAGGVVTVCDEAHLRAALAGGGTVTFACSGTITLSAEIVIAADTTIDGSGQDVTISGNDAVRVFIVNEGVTFNLLGLTISHGLVVGDDGGGIYNGGRSTVNVSNCTFSGNSAEYGDGGVHGEGGAIFNGQNGTLNVGNSAFAGNSAYYGGGVYNAGTLTVRSSTFSDNYTISPYAAMGSGGGVLNDGDYGATAVVSDSAFADNVAISRGGGISAGGTMTVTNSTFDGNRASHGGGISDLGGTTLTVSNSTFSGNTATSGGGITIVFVGRVTISHSIFDGNRGGGVDSWNSMLTVTSSTFTDNSANGAGGGILSQFHPSAMDNFVGGTLIVSNSTFSGNSAVEGGGGIGASGTLTVTNSTFDSNSAEYGGGIFDIEGTATVTNSSFDSNSADYGGGIGAGGTLTVTNSTFDGNEARSGGGIYTSAALTVTNSTFAGNDASGFGGGIWNDGYGTVSVSNSTFSDNSADSGAGGLHNTGRRVMTLKNTIVANSVADANCFGTIADGGGNLSYPDTSCPGINADPVLGPLQDNGGPTLTMEPGPGSPAIDTGNDATCAADPVNNLDQRGVVRPQGTHCDIGAVEHLLPFRIWCPLVYAQPASASTLVSVCDEAHLLAAISGGGTITFDCSGAITLTTPITITANTTIDGSGQDVTISGNHAVRVFKVNYGATLNLNGLTIANGSATSGAGVLNYGTLALDNSTFSGNSVTCDYCTGGGIFNIGALSVSNSTFSGNSMPGVFCNGGDIANRWGTVTINNSSFSGNTVNVGGAIFNQSGAVTVTNSTFSGETAGRGLGLNGKRPVAGFTQLHAARAGDRQARHAGPAE